MVEVIGNKLYQLSVSIISTKNRQTPVVEICSLNISPACEDYIA